MEMRVMVQLLAPRVEYGEAANQPKADPSQAPAPDTTSPLESRRPGGLGVQFAESLLDGLSYERRGEENHVRLTWRLPAPGAPAGTADGNR